jgi:glycosyltransferase involved in cell wall biosynthesis
MDLSIVIPHRGDTIGLWATIQSCEAELKKSHLTHEYVIVTNGEPQSVALQILLKATGTTADVVSVHSDVALTPPVARQRGASKASGDTLCFLDNHCLVSDGYFERAVLATYGQADELVHSSTVFYEGDGTHYHYRLKLDYNFWGETEKEPVSQEPYPIAVAGHGGFVTGRKLWDKVGGYGPESLFDGYGGEEVMFDLKLARYGYTNVVDPKLIHYHYPGERSYSRHYTDGYYTNMMVSALVVGGEEWLYRVFDSFVTRPHIHLYPKEHMYALLQTAYKRGIEYSKEVDSKSSRSLNEVLADFRRLKVAM